MIRVGNTSSQQSVSVSAYCLAGFETIRKAVDWRFPEKALAA